MDEAGFSRHHVDVLGRSVHYRRGGAGPPVLLLHASPRSGAALLPLMAMAPPGATLFAFDTPGCGASDPIGLDAPDAGAYADALADTLAALGIGRAAVYGTHTGAAIALAFAVRHPLRVAALVLDGLSLFDDAECAHLDDYLPPFLPRVDGSHMAWLWTRVRDQQLFFPWHERRTTTRLWRPMPTTEQLHAAALDLLRAGEHYRAPYAAAFRFQPQAGLAQLAMPVFIGARPDDVLFGHLQRLPACPANVRVAPLPADDRAWGERIWGELLGRAAAIGSEPPAAADPLPRERLGSAFVGAPGARLHLRGALGGAGRPLLLLHDSPGSARGLDGLAARFAGQRPVLVPDLPAHGDSDGWHGPMQALPLACAVDVALRAIGIDAADVEGAGAGSCIAAACASLQPARYRSPPATPPHMDAVAAGAFTPRADGGQLHAAWQHARDAAILGPAWTRPACGRHDFGDAIDLAAVQRLCIAALVEAPQAAAMRRGLLRQAGQAQAGAVCRTYLGS